MVEIWLSQEGERLRLPVLPSEYSVNFDMITEVVNIHELGEVLLLGKRKLKNVQIDSYFPKHQQESLADYFGYPEPGACIEMLQRWQEKQGRLMIVGEGLEINIPVVFESVVATVKGGPEDVWYSIKMIEYVEVKPSAVSDRNLLKPRSAKPSTAKPTKYAFKSGDTLTSIAKSVYGDATKWKELAQKNGITDPKKIKDGTVLTL